MPNFDFLCDEQLFGLVRVGLYDKYHFIVYDCFVSLQFSNIWPISTHKFMMATDKIYMKNFNAIKGYLIK